jgi:moderate conductance mechanosensitive channel
MLKFVLSWTQERHPQFPRWYYLLGSGTSAISLLFLSLAMSPASGQTPELSGISLSQIERSLRPNNNDQIETAKVKLDGHTLFGIAAPNIVVGKDVSDAPTPISQRQQSVENTLNRIVSRNFNSNTLTIRSDIDPNAGLPVITINNQYLMTVTTLDAQLQGSTPERWAKELTVALKVALLRAERERQPKYLIRQGMMGGGILLGMVVTGSVVSRVQRRLRNQKAEMEAETESNSLESESTDLVTLSTDTLTVLPLQQQRLKALNDVKRRVLQIAQVAVWGGGTIALLGLFPYTRWLQPVVLSTPLKVLGIGFGVYVLLRLSDALVDRLFEVVETGQFLSLDSSQRLSQRVCTVSRVTKSVTSILLVGTGALAGLAVLGVDLIPLLAGAGIIGLGISLASQNVIKDVINGFLILFEDQYAVGDVVAIGDVGGLVENMNLRITQLRNNEGRLITIPNSAITIVQNLSKGWSRVDLTLTVAFDTNPDRALQILRKLSEEIYRDRAWRSKILELPEVLGIDEMDHTGLKIRIWIKTRPLEQWAVAREFRRRLKQTMVIEHLEIGVPQQFLHFCPGPESDAKTLDTLTPTQINTHAKEH